MNEMKIVKASGLDGWNMSVSMLFGRSPKFDIRCGNCKRWFSRRFNLDDFPDPVAKCPQCKAMNVVPIKYE